MPKKDNVLIISEINYDLLKCPSVDYKEELLNLPRKFPFDAKFTASTYVST